MNPKQLIVALVAAAVLGGSVAFANHMGIPPVSKGGELAYVRDFPADALPTGDDGQHVTATYVAFDYRHTGQADDRLERFDSRGRIADTQLLQKVGLPDGTFEEARFVAVDHVERGLLVTEGESACFLSLNGVNAGLGVVSKGEQTVRFQTTGQFDVDEVSDQRAELSRDGHTYVLEVIGGGTFDVNGVNVIAELGDRDQVRGYIDQEYPATTKVMNFVFDHVTQDGDGACDGAVPTETPEEVTEDEPPAEQEPPEETEPPEEEPPAEEEPAGPLNVNKSGSHDGQRAIFNLLVANDANESATDVVLNDSLPEADGGELGQNPEWLLGGPDSEACTLEANQLECTWDEIEAGGSREVEVGAYQSRCVPLENTANVAGTIGNESFDDSDDAVAVGDDCADAALDKTAQRSGHTVTFTLTVSSIGEGAVHDVELSDHLTDPESEPWLGGPDSEACELEGANLTCSWDEIPSGEERVVTLSAYFSPCRDVSNDAEVSASDDSDESNNQASATEPADECPDVAVNKTSSRQNHTITWDILVESVGEADASNVSLTDEVPPGTSDFWLGGADSEDCELDENNLTCSWDTIPVGESRHVTVSAYYDPCVSHENTARVSADNDANPENDESTAVEPVDEAQCGEPEPSEGDAALSKSAARDGPENNYGHFTLNVSSQGPDAVEDVVLTDSLPAAESEWSIMDGDAEACSIEADTLTCEWASIAAGDSRWVEVHAIVDPCKDYANDASVAASNDVNAENDVASATIEGDECPDAGVDKSGERTADDQAVYTIVVSALGPGPSAGVELADELHVAQSEWFLAGPDAEDCVLDGRDLSCSWDEIAEGESRTVEVRAYIAHCAPYANTADIESDVDANAENDSSTATIAEADDC